MKAYTRQKYGGPEVLQLNEIDKPIPKENEVLVKVNAVSVNPADWHMMRGKPNFMRLMFGLSKPKEKQIGADFSGIIEAVGTDIKHYKVGDEVYGDNMLKSFAQFVCVKEDKFAHKPNTIDHHQMAALPIAAITALQALRDHGKLKPGQSVLINGASGGVGHFAIQIAKYYDAHVTAICSGKNLTFVRELGADEVIDYTKTKLNTLTSKYDLIVDCNGNLNIRNYLHLSSQNKRGVMIGFTTMGHMMKLMLLKGWYGLVRKMKIASFTAQVSTKDLDFLAQLIAEGNIKSHIDKVYPFEELPDAIKYIETMHARGKVIVTV